MIVYSNLGGFAGEVSNVLRKTTKETKSHTIPHASIKEVVEMMKTLIAKGKSDPRAIAFARSLMTERRDGIGHTIRKEIPGRDFDGIAKRLYSFMQSEIKYHRDPAGMEWLQDWEVSIKERAGDCDDYTILAATLFGALGVSTRIKVVQIGKSYDHVFLEYFSPKQNKWIPFDAIVPKSVGWESKDIKKIKIFKL